MMSEIMTSRQKRPYSPITATILPSRALALLCGHVKVLEKGHQITLPSHTTVRDALSLLHERSDKFDGGVGFSKEMTEREETKMRTMTLSILEMQPVNANRPSRPLRILNSVDAADLPPPKPASPATTAGVRKMFENLPPAQKPHAIVAETTEERVLPCVSLLMKFQAVDSNESHPRFELARDDCLWDTGAFCCLVSDDFFDDDFRKFLYEDKINDPYRNKH